MKPVVVSWNGTNLNSGAYSTHLLPNQLASLTNNPVIVNRANDYPFLSTAQRNGNFLLIGVIFSPGYAINTYRETLKGLFFSDLAKHNLIIADEDNNNLQYYRSGIPVSLQNEIVNGTVAENSFIISIATDYPYWQLVTPSVDSWDITASGDSDVVTNIGNIRVPPVITITPTTTKTKGLKYRRYVTIYNNMDKSLIAPLELTDGGLDVQALIDAGKMQADGDDFLLWQDGAFRDRWLSGMDSDSDPAKLWANESLDPRTEAVTSATFDSDDTTIYFTTTKDSLYFLQSLRFVNNRALLVDSEVITWSGDSDIDTIEYTIANLSRGQKNTTAVSHSSASPVRHLEHDPWLMYGDSDLSAPDVDDNYKPIFNLTSTNAAWTWSYFFDDTASRPGMWKGEVLSTKTGLSYTFTDSDPTVPANPSTKLGLAMIGTQSNFNPLNETSTLDWMISHPCGITDASYNGEIYNVSSWPAVVGLQYLLPNTTWITTQNEVAPTTTQTWQTITPRSVSLGGTFETIRFAMDGSLSQSAGDQAMAQFSGVSLSFDSDNLPFISVGSEESINFFDFKLTNNTTGEFILVQCPCPVNHSIVIDCEKRLAYFEDGTPIKVLFSTTREAWLDLAPGSNSLQYDDLGTVAVHVTVSHRDRVL